MTDYLFYKCPSSQKWCSRNLTTGEVEKSTFVYLEVLQYSIDKVNESGSGTVFLKAPLRSGYTLKSGVTLSEKVFRSRLTLGTGAGTEDHLHDASSIVVGVIEKSRLPATAWSEVTDKPTTFPPESHGHTIGQVTGHTKTLHDGLGIDADTLDGKHASELGGGGGAFGNLDGGVPSSNYGGTTPIDGGEP